MWRGGVGGAGEGSNSLCKIGMGERDASHMHIQACVLNENGSLSAPHHPAHVIDVEMTSKQVLEF